jgi:hypothetical protein
MTATRCLGDEPINGCVSVMQVAGPGVFVLSPGASPARAVLPRAVELKRRVAELEGNRVNMNPSQASTMRPDSGGPVLDGGRPRTR